MRNRDSDSQFSSNKVIKFISNDKRFPDTIYENDKDIPKPKQPSKIKSIPKASGSKINIQTVKKKLPKPKSQIEPKTNINLLPKKSENVKEAVKLENELENDVI